MGSQFQKDFYQNDWNSRVDAKNPHLISIVNTVMTFLMFPIVRKILCSNWLDDVKGKLVSGLGLGINSSHLLVK